MNPRPLEGHVALVTGSSTGLGKGILFRLADRNLANAAFRSEERDDICFLAFCLFCSFQSGIVMIVLCFC